MNDVKIRLKTHDTETLYETLEGSAVPRGTRRTGVHRLHLVFHPEAAAHPGVSCAYQRVSSIYRQIQIALPVNDGQTQAEESVIRLLLGSCERLWITKDQM